MLKTVSKKKVFLSENLSFLKNLLMSDLSYSEFVIYAGNYNGYQRTVADLGLLQHLNWSSL